MIHLSRSLGLQHLYIRLSRRMSSIRAILIIQSGTGGESKSGVEKIKYLRRWR